MPGPRMVGIKEKTIIESRQGGWGRKVVLRPIDAPPSLILVCKESFDIASSVYKKSFPHVHRLPETWFDFEQDLLHIHVPAYPSRLTNPSDAAGRMRLLNGTWSMGITREYYEHLSKYNPDLKKVRNLAIPHLKYFGRHAEAEMQLLHISILMKLFPKLQRLVFIIEDHGVISDRRWSVDMNIATASDIDSARWRRLWSTKIERGWKMPKIEYEARTKDIVM